jgi:DNA polymerase-4
MNKNTDQLTSEQDRVQWLFMDLNSYFASVEQQEDPYLRGKPVAVVPMDTPHTCAIAASYEAKAYGIKTGTIIRDAKKMCPNLICVVARHDKYVEYHHRILDEVIKHVPINKIWSVDELSSKLPARLQPVQEAVAAAQRLKQGIRDNVGIALGCSVGLAPNSFLAKVAAEMQKPDGLVVLRKCDLPGPLLDLKLSDLPGIGHNMEIRLHHAGIKTMKDFWDLSPKHARRIWRSVIGERFWYNVHGIEVPDIETNTSVIGHSRVLDPNLRQAEQARLVVRRLTVKAATRLRRKGFFAKRIYLKFRTTDERRFGSEERLPPSQDNQTFLKAIDTLWESLVHGHNVKSMKKVSITLYDLCEKEEITPDLFDFAGENTQIQEKKRSETLSAVMDGLNAKYGAEALQWGISPQTKGGYVGTKIAFSRIPDREEFNE